MALIREMWYHTTMGRVRYKSACEKPFRLDVGGDETLSDQLTANLRRAIADGTFRPGDRLPGIREMARLCRTSVKIPLAAMETLASEGLVKARPRIGCIVLDERRKIWKGRVLLVYTGVFGRYNTHVQYGEIAERLTRADWRVESLFITNAGPRKPYDLSRFDAIFAEKYDLIIFPGCCTPILDIAVKNARPYFDIGGGGVSDDPFCIGRTYNTIGGCYRELVARCQKSGVRHVLHVGHVRESVRTMRGEFHGTGIKVEDLVLDPGTGPDRLDDFQRTGYVAIAERLSNRRLGLPDLVYFSDDYLARSGLWALSDMGLDAPEDIKVVTFCNHGFLPAYRRTLARIENNPAKNGEKTANAIIRYLEKGIRPRRILYEMKYVDGETF